MVGPHYDMQTRTFADRFIPDGDGYRFRANLRSPTYACTTEERDRIIDEYTRRSWWLVLGMVASSLLGVWGMGIGNIVLNGSPLDRSIEPIVVVVWVVPYFLILSWLWNAPSRAFAGRTPVAPALPAKAANRESLAQLRWTELATTTLPCAGFFAWRACASGSPLHGWYALYSISACAFVVFFTVQAIRKLLARS